VLSAAIHSRTKERLVLQSYLLEFRT
jgi:hypothetical protein